MRSLFQEGFQNVGHLVWFVDGVAICDPAVWTHDPVLGIQCARNISWVHLVLADGCSVHIYQNGETEAEVVSESLKCLCRVVWGDGPNAHALVTKGLPDTVFDVRDLGRTNWSPGREIDQYDGVAQLIGEPQRVSIDVFQHKVGGFFSNGERGTNGFGVCDLD